MKLSKIYRKQIWRCNKCKGEVKSQDIELIPISQEIEKPTEVTSTLESMMKLNSTMKFTYPHFCTYVDKRGVLCSALSDKLGESNFNKMMKCPNCGFIALQGFDKINQNPNEVGDMDNGDIIKKIEKHKTSSFPDFMTHYFP